MTHPDHLSAKVSAVNKAHKQVKELYTLLAPFFAQYVGKQVVKDGGSLLKRIQDKMPALPNNEHVRTYKYNSQRALTWAVKVCEIESRGAVYYESSVTIGELHNGVLTKIRQETPDCRTDYTVDEVKRNQAEVAQARVALHNAECKMIPFKEND